jgi:hypothetical protein
MSSSYLLAQDFEGDLENITGIDADADTQN